MPAPQRLEIEVKFLVADLDALRRRLPAAGGRQVARRTHERNLVLDTADRRLRQADQLLRLRQDQAVRLTFKGRSREAEQGSEAKVREELELALDDFDTAVQLFQRLGLTPWWTYEKFRETWRLGEVELVLDELPYGNFVELEGAEPAIKQAAQQLTLPWEQRVLHSHLELMDRLKSRYGLAFDDLTFANFADLSISVADVLS